MEDAIYGFYLSLNSNVSSVYWADIVNKPDVFLVAEIEGEGVYLIPEIRFEYAGGPLLMKLLHRRIPSGRRVIIMVMDDDTLTNTIWNNILQTRNDYSLRGLCQAFAGEPSCLTMLKAEANVQGTFQLLDSPILVDAPDLIAWIEFVVPSYTSEPWKVDGNLVDAAGRNSGILQFAQIWTPQQEADERARREEQAAIEQAQRERVQAESEARAARLKTIFWTSIAVIGSIVLLVYLLRYTTEKASPSQP